MPLLPQSPKVKPLPLNGMYLALAPKIALGTDFGFGTK